MLLRRKIFTMPSGLKIVADIAGVAGAPAVILAHGGGQTRHSWAKAMTKIADQGYHVINYDARGHGESSWAENGDYGVSARWADMAHLIEQVGTSFAIVGASMGGSTALYGLSQGVTPSAVVLVDIAPLSNRAGVVRVMEFMKSGLNGFDSPEEAAQAVAVYNPHRKRRPTVRGLMKNLRFSEVDGRWYWHWDPRFVDLDFDAERKHSQRSMNALLKAHELPVMLVRGAESDVITREDSVTLRARLPNLEFAEIGGAGHMVAGDKNDDFNDVVVDFLTRRMPASPELGQGGETDDSR